MLLNCGNLFRIPNAAFDLRGGAGLLQYAMVLTDLLGDGAFGDLATVRLQRP